MWLPARVSENRPLSKRKSVALAGRAGCRLADRCKSRDADWVDGPELRKRTAGHLLRHTMSQNLARSCPTWSQCLALGVTYAGGLVELSQRLDDAESMIALI